MDKIKKPKPIILEGTIPEIKASFKKFREDIAAYFTFKGISNMTKKVQVMHCVFLIGNDATDLFNIMESNGDFDDSQDYHTLLKNMETIFVENRECLTRYFKFIYRMQGAEEKFDEYLSALYGLRPITLQACTEKNDDETLRRQILKGLYNIKMRQKLIVTKGLNLESTIQMCRVMEQKIEKDPDYDLQNCDLLCNLSSEMQTMSIQEDKVDEGETSKNNEKYSGAAEYVEETDGRDGAVHNFGEEDNNKNDNAGYYEVDDKNVGSDAVTSYNVENDDGYYDFRNHYAENNSNNKDINIFKTIASLKRKKIDNNLGNDAVPNYDTSSKRIKTDNNLGSDACLSYDSEDDDGGYYDSCDHCANNNDNEDKEKVNLLETIVSHKRKNAVYSSDDDDGNQNDKDYCPKKSNPSKKKALNVKCVCKKSDVSDSDEGKIGTMEASDAKQESNSDFTAAMSPEHASFVESILP